MSTERPEGTTKQRLDEIQERVSGATPDSVEEEPGWIISESLRRTSPAGCRVYSPFTGFVRNQDYQLFLHAHKDITFLLERIRQQEEKLNEGNESV